MSEETKTAEVQPVRPPLSALQRIEILEAEVNNLRQAIQAMDASIEVMSENLQKQVRFNAAFARVLKDGKAISLESINAAVFENKIDALKAPIIALTGAGLLAPAETVSLKSIVVGKELKKGDRTVISERMQMMVRDLVKAAKARIINKKVGDEVELVDGADFLFVVTEIHDVQEPKQAPAPEAPAEAPQAAPAAEEPKAEEKGPEAPEKN